jgi:hypothetical protein
MIKEFIDSVAKIIPIEFDRFTESNGNYDIRMDKTEGRPTRLCFVSIVYRKWIVKRRIHHVFC